MAEGMDFLEAFPAAVDKAIADFDGKTKPTLNYYITFARENKAFYVQFPKDSAKDAAAAWMRLFAGKKRAWPEFRAVFVDEWAKRTSTTAAELRAAEADSKWERVFTSSVKAMVDRILGLLEEEKKKQRDLEEKKKQQEEQAARRAEEKRKRAPINKILAEFSAIGARK